MVGPRRLVTPPRHRQGFVTKAARTGRARVDPAQHQLGQLRGVGQRRGHRHRAGRPSRRRHRVVEQARRQEVRGHRDPPGAGRAQPGHRGAGRGRRRRGVRHPAGHAAAPRRARPPPGPPTPRARRPGCPPRPAPARRTGPVRASASRRRSPASSAASTVAVGRAEHVGHRVPSAAARACAAARPPPGCPPGRGTRRSAAAAPAPPGVPGAGQRRAARSAGPRAGVVQVRRAHRPRRDGPPRPPGPAPGSPRPPAGRGCRGPPGPTRRPRRIRRSDVQAALGLLEHRPSGPARGSSPALVRRVHGQQPIEP